LRERRRVKALEKRDRQRVQELAGRTDLRLNIGSSSNHLPGWISIDIRADDICLGMDAAQPWPFVANSAEAINSEHFIEHLDPDGARTYLAEAYRVLSPGGVLRTTTPDLRGIAELFLEGDPAVLDVHRSHGYDARTHGDMLNNYLRCWGHQHVYEFEGLRALLEETGFTEVEQAEFGASRHAPLAGIDRHDPEELRRTVLCVDAVKPSPGTGGTAGSPQR
jgi:predicted SAM-dependent methyltransferase